MTPSDKKNVGLAAAEVNGRGREGEAIVIGILPTLAVLPRIGGLRVG